MESRDAKRGAERARCSVQGEDGEGGEPVA